MTYTTETKYFDQNSPNPTVAPHAAAKVEPDGWNGYAGTLYVCEDWDAAEWRLTTRHEGLDLAVNVEVTGRVVYHLNGNDWVKTRVRVTFVGDGEPDVEVRGWMYFNANRYRGNDYAPNVGKPWATLEAEKVQRAAVEAHKEAQRLEEAGLKASQVANTVAQALRGARDAGLLVVADGLVVAETVARAEARDYARDAGLKYEEARELQRKALWG
jgi:hypothetical protein